MSNLPGVACTVQRTVLMPVPAFWFLRGSRDQTQKQQRQRCKVAEKRIPQSIERDVHDVASSVGPGWTGLAMEGMRMRGAVERAI
jgi:hypothetical protein